MGQQLPNREIRTCLGGAHGLSHEAVAAGVVVAVDLELDLVLGTTGKRRRRIDKRNSMTRRPVADVISKLVPIFLCQAGTVEIGIVPFTSRRQVPLLRLMTFRI
jgi:hypothetical protein